MARRCVATASFSAWRSRLVRGSVTCGKCLIFGRCAPTFCSLGFAYGSMQKLTRLICNEQNGKRGELKNDRKQRHSHDRFFVKQSHCGAPEKPRNPIPSIKQTKCCASFLRRNDAGQHRLKQRALGAHSDSPKNHSDYCKDECS